MSNVALVALLICIFLLGLMAGYAIAKLFTEKKTATGYFTVEPYDEEDTGFYCVNMRIPPENQFDLIKQERLILYREHSQK